MLHIYQLFYDALSETAQPEFLQNMPVFDGNVHTPLGTLPLMFQRVFIRLQNLSQNAPLDLAGRKAFDHNLNQGYALLRKCIGEFFNIEPLVKVVICQE